MIRWRIILIFLALCILEAARKGNGSHAQYQQQQQAYTCQRNFPVPIESVVPTDKVSRYTLPVSSCIMRMETLLLCLLT
jgi:hypothetical protein